MPVPYFTCDVFTEHRFGGNQLAVLPDARGLSPEQMQRIAREFGYSETTFVLPPEAGGTRRVRIFTPMSEVPFAGHPNIGTAFVLASTGALGPVTEQTSVVFEEAAGPVPVAVRPLGDGRFFCELTAPQGLSLGTAAAAADVAAAVALDEDDVVTAAHPPLVASVGLPFLIAELRDREALARARPVVAGIEALLAQGLEVPDLFVYVRCAGEVDVRARMFSPLDGIPEDAATGSATCALAGLLAHLDAQADGDHAWRLAQGVEMGRPSLLHARAAKRGGEVTGVWVGGESVPVAEGRIEV